MMLSFKDIRSKVSKIFTESQQMKIVVFISSIFWFFRKYFLGVEIKYPSDFLDNWNQVKNFSCLDKERSFTLYQYIGIHNKVFQNTETNVIEFGVSQGSSLITLSRFIKPKTNIYGVDSFGEYADDIKKLSTSNDDKNYLGKEVAFNKKTRFKNFSVEILNEKIRKIENFEKFEKELKMIVGHFPSKLSDEDLKLINNKKYSFCYMDFDLKISTLNALEFILPRLLKGAIVIIDDYNFINQEGCKLAVTEFGLDIKSCFQTQSGQLVYFHN